MTTNALIAAQSSVVAPIRIREARDLLAAIPYLLSYRPFECLLVVCVQASGALGLIARTALADLVTPAQQVTTAKLIARRAIEDATVYAYLIVYSTAEQLPGTELDDLIEEFTTALGVADVPAESWLVGEHTFRNLDCRDQTCCPRAGHRLQLLESSVVGAELVLSGLAPAASRERAYEVRPASEPQCALARRAASGWQTLGQVGAAAERTRWRLASLDIWRRCVHNIQRDHDVDPGLAGPLYAALQDTAVRDAVLLATLPGGSDIGEVIVDAGDKTSETSLDEQVRLVLNQLLLPGRAAAPDLVELDVASRVLEAVVSLAPRSGRVAPLTILALLAWCAGDGGRAGFRLNEALRIDPDYHLAALIGQLINAGLPPGWLRADSR